MAFWKTLYSKTIGRYSFFISKNPDIIISFTLEMPIRKSQTIDHIKYEGPARNYLSLHINKKFKFGYNMTWYDGPFYDWHFGFIGIYYSPWR